MTKIKICGLFRDVDAKYINDSKPDYAGFVIGVPKSKRNIDYNTAERLRELINKNIPTVGVFVNHPVENIASLVNDGIISIVQLHGSEDDVYIEKLREFVPTTEIWKAFVLKTEKDIKTANRSTADKVLLDSGTGCGKLFDWSVLRGINREFILAGGLNSENIPLAVSQVHPFAVDLSSGIETNGVKDADKIDSAVKSVRC